MRWIKKLIAAAVLSITAVATTVGTSYGQDKVVFPLSPMSDRRSAEVNSGCIPGITDNFFPHRPAGILR
jgi:hypothetical protein